MSAGFHPALALTGDWMGETARGRLLCEAWWGCDGDTEVAGTATKPCAAAGTKPWDAEPGLPSDTVERWWASWRKAPTPTRDGGAEPREAVPLRPLAGADACRKDAKFTGMAKEDRCPTRGKGFHLEVTANLVSSLFACLAGLSSAEKNRSHSALGG